MRAPPQLWLRLHFRLHLGHPARMPSPSSTAARWRARPQGSAAGDRFVAATGAAQLLAPLLPRRRWRC